MIKFKLLSSKAILPEYSNKNDAGFDLYSPVNCTIKKGEIKTIHLAISSEFSSNKFVSIRDRSSLASKYGLHVLAGIIDCDYRGEWGVVLVNLGKKKYKINAGDRIAQGILQPLINSKITKVNILSKSMRGTGGFGSSGK